MQKRFVENVEREPKIEVNGNEIIYLRAISHLCCRNPERSGKFSDKYL
jgi:hypothetical protein